MVRACIVGFLTSLVAVAAPAYAQLAHRPQAPKLQQSPNGSVISGELHGSIEDDKGQPLAGAVISALGSSIVVAISDREGRFAFRNLPAGPYLVRAHLQGFVPPRARVIQVTAGGRHLSTFSLNRVGESETPAVLAAGVGSVGGGKTDDDEHNHGEVEWRMRHATRSVLKDAEEAVANLGGDDSLFGDSLNGLGRAVGSSARFATALFADLPLSGQVNLLTTTSFDRPQDLFSLGVESPRGVAYVSLSAPGGNGDWTLRGTVTQGDLASWMVASSYVRRESDNAHRYEAGVSYSMQRYMGGNIEALFAMRDGSRNAGSVYAYDDWTVAPRVRVGYGGRFARYDYLPDRSLISPRASVVVQPVASDSLRLRASVSHRETAPGEQEFLPPSAGLWLPPERTFSQVSREAFRPERVDHVEIAAEREWPGAVVVGVRAFRQRADDQVVTLFGVAVGDRESIGHYHVGSAGDFDARGWGVSASRSVAGHVRAAVDYTQVDSSWYGRSPDAAALASLAASALRTTERLHDVTASIESVVSPTATRLFVVYRMNSGFADHDSAGSFVSKARFNVQVNQALPFFRNWEMLVAVSNLFREDPIDGSVYDEVMVLNPTKRVLGGVSVRF
jgi:hypothetical protein